MATIFKPSRILAVVLIAGAGAWIYSGQLSPHANETAPATATTEAAATAAPARVSVKDAVAEEHQRQVILSCTTQADQSSVAVARGLGVIVALKVDRGAKVTSGEVIATLSDEGRDSAVKQAQALLEQRKAEYTANKRLIDQGNAPKNNLPALEAGLAAAEAAVSAAEAEADRSQIRSPLDGIVDSVPVQVGQAVQPGAQIAEIIDPDPMLAVGAVSERQRGSLSVGQKATIRFIDGKTIEGVLSFVGISADKATRTYRVEAKMANADAAIPDGVTCEMAVALDPVEAVAVPRSALVFSDTGELGVRVVSSDGRAQFMPIQVVDDAGQIIWATAMTGTTRLIVVGQDFVKDGDPVEAVTVDAATAKGPPA